MGQNWDNLTQKLTLNILVKVMALTDTECKKSQPRDKQYRLSDSNGLSLRIDPNGNKYWNVRISVQGQRKSESLGKYPEVSLKKARELAYELKYKYSKAEQLDELKPLFREVGEDWFNNQKDRWSHKHILNVRVSLDEVYLSLENKCINLIQSPEILQNIKKLRQEAHLKYY